VVLELIFETVKDERGVKWSMFGLQSQFLFVRSTAKRLQFKYIHVGGSDKQANEGFGMF